MASSPFLPETIEYALDKACRRAGVDPSDAVMLRLGENVLYRLASVPVVVRIARGPAYRMDACKEIAVASWLASQGIAGARVFELGCEQPLDVNGLPVTFWSVLAGRPGNDEDSEALGKVLLTLHGLDRPSFDLPSVEPFGRMAARLASAPIPRADSDLLRHRVAQLTDELAALRFQLPSVAVHGDAHVGNLMIVDGSPVLIDFETFAWGPAEWDLAKIAAECSVGMVDRRHYDAFATAYGHDVTTWSGWPVLRDIQRVKMVSWLAQNIEHSARVRDEYAKRIETIRTGVVAAPWRGF
ncbi:aminoglycoside phosphotransferase family protein [Nocardia higoensis]|uniref:aminoglycoside phosphotransferase family protein n=1 Tax=Nocardia higoensis TaxID=228599 RepID=UPI00030DED3C|nr:aminoglycoside phosphotransferase family protein [Nocardia higoensis]